MMGKHDTDRKPVETLVTVAGSDGSSRTFTASELMALAGMSGSPSLVRMSVRRDGIELYADAQPAERDYPGITVDARVRDCCELFLGNFEMPCETYPNRIAARLYAGDSRYETDGPIAIVTHETEDTEKTDRYAAEHGRSPRPMKKLVYVDHDIAGSRTWSEAGEQHMPEHEEDE